MPSNKEEETWTADQITKSSFFHQKLHEWGLLEIAHELEDIKGEKLEWNRKHLYISDKAWNKVIHRGIKPLRVFTHPQILKQNPKRVSYYRMLAMVSQKSMSRVNISIGKYEIGTGELKDDTAVQLSRHLNKIISGLIEYDEQIDSREFDLWRGMSAGSQAQGSWQNTKGDKAEVVVKDLIKKRLLDKNLVAERKPHGKGEEVNYPTASCGALQEREPPHSRVLTGPLSSPQQAEGYSAVTFIKLKDKRQFVLGSEPDISIYEKDSVQLAIEIKGGIDPAGALERFGAVLKSLRRAKQENPKSATILIVQGVSLTSTVKEEVNKSKEIIDHLFKIEELVGNEDIRKQLFEILRI